MIDAATKAKYIPAIGIECHVQLKTKTKLFAAVGNDARDAAPNTLISFICLGMPGALPVLNEKAVEYAMRVGFAFHVEPQRHSYFERKHYFYPDLPKGYQITQLEHPVVVGGYVEIAVDGEKKKVRVNRVQIEEDAGKSMHPAGKDYSLVDLNRAGTPLLEIVSEPDIKNAAEAKAYVRELWLLMRYAGVSDADLYHGNMRFDVNVSISPDSQKLGTRTETKNLNSFRSVERAVEYEIARQIELLEKGQTITQETRGWDEAKQRTVSQRGKEEAHDYRYFPDPDIPPLEITPDIAKKVKDAMPMLPGELREKLSELKLDPSAVETLIEAMPAGKFISDLIDQNTDKATVKRIANWLASDVQALVAAEKVTWEAAKLERKAFQGLAKLTQENQVSSTSAKVILTELVLNGGDPAEIAKSKNLLQVSDTGEIEKIVAQVITDNPKAAEDIKNGEMKAIGFLVGQVMKASKGQANPAMAQDMIKKKLS
jgi:aspartyl-tRNA(Asn)/glutamyl-tRNA(Gln) amidotransferase subunit B